MKHSYLRRSHVFALAFRLVPCLMRAADDNAVPSGCCEACMGVTDASVLLQQSGRIYCAAFTDEALFSELAHKAIFWQQQNFFGVDLSSLHAPALEGYFSQVCTEH